MSTVLANFSIMMLLMVAPQDRRFENLVRVDGPVVIDGWARVHGEIMLFANRRAMKKGAEYPNCISGHLGTHGLLNLRKFDRKRVRLIGTTFSYNSLPEDNAPIGNRRVLDGLTIPNQCMGARVILIKKIEVLSG